MRVRDLKSHIYEKVSIYKQKNGSWDDFEDVYNGDMQTIPEALLDFKVNLIGAKRKGIVDISIKDDID